jgi:hypothetical protein
MKYTIAKRSGATVVVDNRCPMKLYISRLRPKPRLTLKPKPKHKPKPRSMFRPRLKYNPKLKSTQDMMSTNLSLLFVIYYIFLFAFYIYLCFWKPIPFFPLPIGYGGGWHFWSGYTSWCIVCTLAGFALVAGLFQLVYRFIYTLPTTKIYMWFIESVSNSVLLYVAGFVMSSVTGICLF